MSPEDIRTTHPIADRIEGWYFRVVERSPDCHYAEAINAKGRKVSANGPDGESALLLCARSVEIDTRARATRKAARLAGRDSRE